jgi:RimJ/RimL family protein N-acetyltransferase
MFFERYKSSLDIFNFVAIKLPSGFLLTPVKFDIIDQEATIYLANSKDELVKKYLPNAYPANINDAKSKLLENTQRQQLRQGVFFCIRPVEAPMPIGYILLNSPISGSGLGEWSLDFWINKRYRKKGIMTICLNRILDYMQKMEVPGIVATIYPENLASAKTLKKTGFVYRHSNRSSGQDLYAQRLN